MWSILPFGVSVHVCVACTHDTSFWSVKHIKHIKVYFHNVRERDCTLFICQVAECMCQWHVAMLHVCRTVHFVVHRRLPSYSHPSHQQASLSPAQFKYGKSC